MYMSVISDTLSRLKGLNFFSKSGGSVLGVDIGSSSIKIVQLRKKKGVIVLETYGALALGPAAKIEIGRATNLSADKIADVLIDLIKEANITTKSCGISIPISASLVIVIDMPPLSPKQLKAMIPIEARKYIPVPITEVELDWFILPENELKFRSQDQSKEEDKKSKTQVLIVAIHKETLSKYSAIVKKADLDASFFEIEIFSTIRSAIERSIQPVAILDIGAGISKLYIVEYGIVRISHTINKGGQDMTFALSKSIGVDIKKAERMKREFGLIPANTKEGSQGVSESVMITLQFIFGEAKRAILKYEKQYKRNISKVVFTGGGAVTRGILDIAKEHFEAEIILADPFSHTETPAFLENVLQEVGPEFAVAVGLALRKLQKFQ